MMWQNIGTISASGSKCLLKFANHLYRVTFLVMEDGRRITVYDILFRRRENLLHFL